ncbi:MAG: hypothetical protein D3925_16090 [Candidatus Electrothrix sp. AR5]|nr:hypothetical protein [Candidatus Electrothrix sp. AR5]
MKLSVIGFAVACLLVAGSAFAGNGEELAKGCKGCHSGAMARDFATIAADLQKEDDKGKARVSKAILEGAEVGGKKMPPQAAFAGKVDDINSIADWIISQAPASE